LALNDKGGEINRPKQKDRTTTLFSENFLQNIAFAKTLLTANGRTFLGGAFILPKEKHLKKEENLSKLEIAFRIHILIALANCKRI
jgi:hypothetical protein